MTRVWPIAELDGREILAEWTLVHAAEGGRMLIRLWDGNEHVHIHISDADGGLGVHPASADTYDHGYRQVVTDLIPGLAEQGWTVAESEVAEGIGAPDAEFSAVCCPTCGFGHPWWNGADESCRLCDVGGDLDFLPYDISAALYRRDFEAMRTSADYLGGAIETAGSLLADLEPEDRPENITALIGPAKDAHRQALARLDAVAAHPDWDAATTAAAGAALAAITHGADVGGWLAEVLARVAATVGSVEALLTNRPGSWEADLVHRLVAGTVGWDDEYLSDHAPTEPTVPDANVVDDGGALNDLGRDYAEEQDVRDAVRAEQEAELAEELAAAGDCGDPDACWHRREDGEPCAKVAGHSGSCEYLGEWRI